MDLCESCATDGSLFAKASDKTMECQLLDLLPGTGLSSIFLPVTTVISKLKETFVEKVLTFKELLPETSKPNEKLIKTLVGVKPSGPFINNRKTSLLFIWSLL